MAGRVQWRRFNNFFDKDTLHENIETALGATPTCGCAEGGLLLFGDNNGSISLCDKNFTISWTHKVFRGPVHAVAYIYDSLNHRKQYVYTVGEEFTRASDDRGSGTVPTGFTVLKIFMTTDMSRPIHAINITLPDASVYVSTLAVAPSGQQVAVGFSDGSVSLYSANFLNELSLSRTLPVSLLQSSAVTGRGSGSITGLYFCELHITSKQLENDRQIRLFVVTDTSSATTPENGILVFDTSCSATGAFFGQVTPKLLDDRGAASLCSSLMKKTTELVIGRSEGLFTYSVEDRGGAAGFEGDKLAVIAVGRYVLVGTIDEKTERTLVTIYDLRNKFIAMSQLLPQGDKIHLLYSDGGNAYIVTTSYMLLRYTEKSINDKIDTLVKKSFYTLAITVATEEQCDMMIVMQLYKQYGDVLFGKADYAGAIQQYCHTIGYILPSYVIKKFLDTQRIHNLIYYLEKLHDRSLATQDHTILLLTCYAKTYNEQKLSEFINKLHIAAKETDGVLPDIDVSTALNTLMSCGFSEHALQLALCYQCHDDYVFILIDKLSDAQRALGYITMLVLTSTQSLTTKLICKHSKHFLRSIPTPFVSLLIKMCTGDFESLYEFLPEASKKVIDKETISQLPVFAIDTFIPRFINHDDQLKVFLEGVLEFQSASVSGSVYEVLVELYLREYDDHRRSIGAQSGATNSAQLSIHSKMKALSTKIMSILDNSHINYNASQLLLLMQTFKFYAGEIYLLEKLHFNDLILQKYIEVGDEKGILRILKREGKKDAELYIQVLHYVISLTGDAAADDVDDEGWDQIKEILELMYHEGLLMPLQIIPILARNEHLPIALILPYLNDTYEDIYNKIDVLENNILAVRIKIQSILQEQTAKQQIASIGQLQGMIRYKDDDNEEEDEFEFMRAEAQKEAEKQKWESIKRAQIERTNEHESFFAELEHSSDGFETVASYFGKTIIS